MSPEDVIPPAAADVLQFWFGTDDDQARVVETHGEIWWGGGEALDAEIAARFGDVVAEARAGGLEDWSRTPRGHLARILVLDQFTRNMYRRKPEAFSGDPIARRLALAAVDDGRHLALRPIERVFVYMPLEHAEDIELQQRCVKLFDALLADAPPEIAQTVAGFAGYARKHHDIIARFGRFPHRNPVLGRAHTAEEKAWLADGGPTFGQG